jgi:2-aminoethylphosphonate-pyruvate transaminase
MAFLDRELARLGLVPVVAPEHRSSCVRSLPLPAGIGYDELHDALKSDGYVIYAGLGKAARSSFRVCVLGAVEIDALAGFVGSLERFLIDHRVVAAAAASPA